VPSAAPKPCPVPGCPSLVTATTACPTHQLPMHAMNWATAGVRPGSTRQWRLRRARVLLDSPLCRACLAAGQVTAAVEVDHIVPRSLGGGDDYDNLDPICRAHHREKSRHETRPTPKEARR